MRREPERGDSHAYRLDAEATSDASISVVIPTVGGDCLRHTLAMLNSGTLRPTEILVCLPDNRAIAIDRALHENVQVIDTGRKGQVRQRIAGFTLAKHDYVLQLDDDMTVERDCLEQLVRQMMSLERPAAIAPIIVFTDTGLSCHARASGHVGWIERRIHGDAITQPGRVTRAGSNVDLDFADSPRSLNESDWIPGGCVLHRRENLVLEDFYPFSGKAYGEDVIHSVFLRRAGVRLFVSKAAKCSMDPPPAGRSVTTALREIYLEFRWRRYLVSLISGCMPCLIADVIHKYGTRALPAMGRRLRLA